MTALEHYLHPRNTLRVLLILTIPVFALSIIAAIVDMDHASFSWLCVAIFLSGPILVGPLIKFKEEAYKDGEPVKARAVYWGIPAVAVCFCAWLSFKAIADDQNVLPTFSTQSSSVTQVSVNPNKVK